MIDKRQLDKTGRQTDSLRDRLTGQQTAGQTDNWTNRKTQMEEKQTDVWTEDSWKKIKDKQRKKKRIPLFRFGFHLLQFLARIF